eukprot:1458450-Alexandrium_andersonii.AAC.1
MHISSSSSSSSITLIIVVIRLIRGLVSISCVVATTTISVLNTISLFAPIATINMICLLYTSPSPRD